MKWKKTAFPFVNPLCVLNGFTWHHRELLFAHLLLCADALMQKLFCGLWAQQRSCPLPWLCLLCSQRSVTRTLDSVCIFIKCSVATQSVVNVHMLWVLCSQRKCVKRPDCLLQCLLYPVMGPELCFDRFAVQAKHWLLLISGCFFKSCLFFMSSGGTEDTLAGSWVRKCMIHDAAPGTYFIQWQSWSLPISIWNKSNTYNTTTHGKHAACMSEVYNKWSCFVSSSQHAQVWIPLFIVWHDVSGQKSSYRQWSK